MDLPSPAIFLQENLMTYPNVCLRRGEAADVRAGQTLIFDNELDWADDTCTDGCIVDVLDEQLRFAARGFFNSRSKITVRVLTRDPSEDYHPRLFPFPHRSGVARKNASRLFRFLPRRLW